MKAIVLTEKNQPVQLVNADNPVADAQEVLIRLRAAALNHRDVFIQQGLYPKIKLPVILGSDGAGTVEAVGEGVDPSLIGSDVLINPGMNWGDNPAFDGPDFQILGMPQNGTFAEYVVVRREYVYPKPAHLSFEQAAALPLTGLTAWRALSSRGRLQIQPSDKPDNVLITGVGGGAALIAMQLSVAAGANVWATSGSDEKISRAKELGAKGGVNYREPDWYKTLLSQAGGDRSGFFDIVIDSACGPNFAKLIDLTTPGGRIVFYGGTTGNITDIIPAKVFFKQLSIFGTTMGNPQEFTDMLSFVNQHKIVPVVDEVFSIQEMQRAMHKMEAGGQFGKLVLTL